jgi:hypothetical protein
MMILRGAFRAPLVILPQPPEGYFPSSGVETQTPLPFSIGRLNVRAISSPSMPYEISR